MRALMPSINLMMTEMLPTLHQLYQGHGHQSQLEDDLAIERNLIDIVKAARKVHGLPHPPGGHLLVPHPPGDHIPGVAEVPGLSTVASLYGCVSASSAVSSTQDVLPVLAECMEGKHSKMASSTHPRPAEMPFSVKAVSAQMPSSVKVRPAKVPFIAQVIPEAVPSSVFEAELELPGVPAPNVFEGKPGLSRVTSSGFQTERGLSELPSSGFEGESGFSGVPSHASFNTLKTVKSSNQRLLPEVSGDIVDKTLNHLMKLEAVLSGCQLLPHAAPSGETVNVSSENSVRSVTADMLNLPVDENQSIMTDKSVDLFSTDCDGEEATNRSEIVKLILSHNRPDTTIYPPDLNQTKTGVPDTSTLADVTETDLHGHDTDDTLEGIKNAQTRTIGVKPDGDRREYSEFVSVAGNDEMAICGACKYSEVGSLCMNFGACKELDDIEITDNTTNGVDDAVRMPIKDKTNKAEEESKDQKSTDTTKGTVDKMQDSAEMFAQLRREWEVALLGGVNGHNNEMCPVIENLNELDKTEDKEEQVYGSCVETQTEENNMILEAESLTSIVVGMHRNEEEVSADAPINNAVEENSASAPTMSAPNVQPTESASAEVVTGTSTVECEPGNSVLNQPCGTLQEDLSEEITQPQTEGTERGMLHNEEEISAGAPIYNAVEENSVGVPTMSAPNVQPTERASGEVMADTTTMVDQPGKYNNSVQNHGTLQEDASEDTAQTQTEGTECLERSTSQGSTADHSQSTAEGELVNENIMRDSQCDAVAAGQAQSPHWFTIEDILPVSDVSNIESSVLKKCDLETGKGTKGTSSMISDMSTRGRYNLRRAVRQAKLSTIPSVSSMQKNDVRVTKHPRQILSGRHVRKRKISIDEDVDCPRKMARSMWGLQCMGTTIGELASQAMRAFQTQSLDADAGFVLVPSDVALDLTVTTNKEFAQDTASLACGNEEDQEKMQNIRTMGKTTESVVTDKLVASLGTSNSNVMTSTSSKVKGMMVTKEYIGKRKSDEYSSVQLNDESASCQQAVNRTTNLYYGVPQPPSTTAPNPFTAPQSPIMRRKKGEHQLSLTLTNEEAAPANKVDSSIDSVSVCDSVQQSESLFALADHTYYYGTCTDTCTTTHNTTAELDSKPVLGTITPVTQYGSAFVNQPMILDVKENTSETDSGQYPGQVHPGTSQSSCPQPFSVVSLEHHYPMLLRHIPPASVQHIFTGSTLPSSVQPVAVQYWGLPGSHMLPDYNYTSSTQTAESMQYPTLLDQRLSESSYPTSTPSASGVFPQHQLDSQAASQAGVIDPSSPSEQFPGVSWLNRMNHLKTYTGLPRKKMHIDQQKKAIHASYRVCQQAKHDNLLYGKANEDTSCVISMNRSKTRKHTVSDRQNTTSYKGKKATIKSNRLPEPKSPKKKVVQSLTKKVAQSFKKKVAESPKKKVVQSPKKMIQSPKKKAAQSPRTNMTHTTISPKKKMTKSHKKMAQSYRKQKAKVAKSTKKTTTKDEMSPRLKIKFTEEREKYKKMKGGASLKLRAQKSKRGCRNGQCSILPDNKTEFMTTDGVWIHAECHTDLYTTKKVDEAEPLYQDDKPGFVTCSLCKKSFVIKVKKYHKMFYHQPIELRCLLCGYLARSRQIIANHLKHHYLRRKF